MSPTQFNSLTAKGWIEVLGLRDSFGPQWLFRGH